MNPRDFTPAHFWELHEHIKQDTFAVIRLEQRVKEARRNETT